MKKITLVVSIAAFAFASCQNNTATESVGSANTVEDSSAVVDMHNSQIALDWNGTYEGTLPCADCPGMKTNIVLKNDNTFSKHVEYLDRKDATFDESGKIEWNKNGNSITLVSSDGEKERFQVREGSLLMLNQDGEEVTGPLAEHYVLSKID